MTAGGKPCQPRNLGRRGGGETRARILDAARRRFSREGYEHAGLREIAGDAGVDAALVNRYFGSKEELFAETIAGAFRIDDLQHLDRAALGASLVRLALSDECSCGADGLAPLSLLLRSAASPTAAAALARCFDSEFVAPLAAWLGGPDARLRAGLIGAYLTGVAVMRQVLRIKAFAPENDRRVADLVGQAIQDCIDGHGPPAGSAPGCSVPRVAVS